MFIIFTDNEICSHVIFGSSFWLFTLIKLSQLIWKFETSMNLCMNPGIRSGKCLWKQNKKVLYESDHDQGNDIAKTYIWNNNNYILYRRFAV